MQPLAAQVLLQRTLHARSLVGNWYRQILFRWSTSVVMCRVLVARDTCQILIERVCAEQLISILCLCFVSWLGYVPT